MNKKITPYLACVFAFMIFFPYAVCEAQEYTLDRLYPIALEYAEKIKLSEEDLIISEANRDKSLSSLLPKISTYAGIAKYTDEKKTSTGLLLQYEETSNWGVRLDQSISLGGREIKALNMSQENIQKSRFDLASMREEYLYTVSSAFFDVLRAGKAVDIAKSNLERLGKHKTAAETKLRVGEVTKTALLRAQAEFSAAKSERVKAENGLKLSRAILSRLTGIAGDFQLKEPDEDYKNKSVFAEQGLEPLKQKALNERTEIKSAMTQKRIADEQLSFAKGGHWPSLGVEGVYSKMNAKPDSVTLNKSSVYGGLKLTLPIFEGGLRVAEVKEATAKQRQASLNFNDLKKSIHIEVERAYLDFSTQKDMMNSNQEQVVFAKDNYNAVSKQFEFGLANSLDVMDANNLLVSSEKQLAETRYNLDLSLLKIKRAAGIPLYSGK